MIQVDPNCTCINLPKKPGGGGGFNFGGGRRRPERSWSPAVAAGAANCT